MKLCEVMRSLCVCVCVCACFKLMQGLQGMHTHTSMPNSSVKKTAGSCADANLLWEKVVGLCGSLVFDPRVWNGDEETTGAVEVNSFFLNLTGEKRACVHKCMHQCE